MKEVFAIQVYNLEKHYDYVIALFESRETANEFCERLNIDFTKDRRNYVSKVRSYNLITEK